MSWDNNEIKLLFYAVEQEEDNGSEEDIPLFESAAASTVADGAGKKSKADRNRQMRRRDVEAALGVKRRLKTQRREIDQLAQRSAEIAEHAAMLAVRKERRQVNYFFLLLPFC